MLDVEDKLLFKKVFNAFFAEDSNFWELIFRKNNTYGILLKIIFGGKRGDAGWTLKLRKKLLTVDTTLGITSEIIIK